VAVLPASEKKKQSSPLLPPKGVDPPDPVAFSLQTNRFQGTAERAMIATMDPGQTL
jgi:hypothetical protein